MGLTIYLAHMGLIDSEHVFRPRKHVFTLYQLLQSPGCTSLHHSEISHWMVQVGTALVFGFLHLPFPAGSFLEGCSAGDRAPFLAPCSARCLGW